VAPVTATRRPSSASAITGRKSKSGAASSRF
jgi:hypothetical protein